MANREQRGNREKKKPKTKSPKGGPATSPFSSMEAKAKAGSDAKKGK